MTLVKFCLKITKCFQYKLKLFVSALKKKKNFNICIDKLYLKFFF